MTGKIQTVDDDKKRITTIDTKLAGQDVYAVTRNEGAELFGFKANDDDDYESRGYGAAAGGRERRERAPRQQQGRGRRGKQGKIEINDESFPAL